MSSASLAVSPRPHVHPDPARIASISAAIALNLAVVLIASRPLGPTRLSPVHQLQPLPTIRLIDPPPVFKAPPAVQLKPLVHAAAVVQPHPHALPISHPVVIPSSEGKVAAVPTAIPNLPAPTTLTDAVAAAPVEASLAYRVAPLHFPLQALRQGMHGTVLLRVLVDESGKPLQVTVERGSGYALLDRSAREQVLAGWRFQPAMVNGHAVRAWARVPVNFDLQE